MDNLLIDITDLDDRSKLDILKKLLKTFSRKYQNQKTVKNTGHFCLWMNDHTIYGFGNKISSNLRKNCKYIKIVSDESTINPVSGFPYKDESGKFPDYESFSRTAKDLAKLYNKLENDIRTSTKPQQKISEQNSDVKEMHNSYWYVREK